MELLNLTISLNLHVATSYLLSFGNSFLKVISENIILAVFFICSVGIVVMYLIPGKHEEYTKKFLWIYCSLLPSIILVLIRMNAEIIENLKNLNNFYLLNLFIIVISLFMPLIIQLIIITYSFRQSPEDVSEMNIIKIHTEGLDSFKLMEYFVVMILPFITIGSFISDKITILYVFAILVVIFIRLDLFYFNLPIMIWYYLHEVTLSDEKKYFLISKCKHLNTVEGVPNKIIIISEELKIAVLIK